MNICEICGTRNLNPLGCCTFLSGRIPFYTIVYVPDEMHRNGITREVRQFELRSEYPKILTTIWKVRIAKSSVTPQRFFDIWLWCETKYLICNLSYLQSNQQTFCAKPRTRWSVRETRFLCISSSWKTRFINSITVISFLFLEGITSYSRQQARWCIRRCAASYWSTRKVITWANHYRAWSTVLECLTSQLKANRESRAPKPRDSIEARGCKLFILHLLLPLLTR